VSMVSATTMLLSLGISDYLSLESKTLFTDKMYSGILSMLFYSVTIMSHAMLFYSLHSFKSAAKPFSTMDTFCLISIFIILFGKLSVNCLFFGFTFDKLPFEMLTGATYTVSALSVLLSLAYSKLSVKPVIQKIEEVTMHSTCPYFIS